MRISDWSSDVCSSDLRAPPLRRATVAALLSSAGCGAEGGDGRAAIAGGDHRLTYEHGIEPGGRERRCVGWPPYARLGDSDHAGRHGCAAPPGPVVVPLEGDEVALVHADELRLDGQRSPEPRIVVDLDRCVEPHPGGAAAPFSPLAGVGAGAG